MLRAPFLTQGYFKKPEASEELWASGKTSVGKINKKVLRERKA